MTVNDARGGYRSVQKAAAGRPRTTARAPDHGSPHDAVGTVVASPRTRRFRRVKLVAAQGAAVAVAAVFLAIGVAGFVPGLTSHLDLLQWYGRHSSGEGAQLMGAFDVSVAHNFMHLGFGVAGLVMARTFGRARLYLLGGGLIYLTLWLYGVVSSYPRELLPLNDADNWLHVAMGVVMVVLGLTLAASRVPTGADGEVLIPE